MKFRFEDYPGEHAMHCKTEEEAKDFCRVMHESGRKWASGKSYLDISNYHAYKGRTHYSFNSGVYGFSFGEYGYTILEWSDFMKKEFTKDDLKVGMLVESRNGLIWMVMNAANDKLILVNDLGNHGSLEYYTNDMTIGMGACSELDIVKIYGFCRYEMYALNLYTKHRELLWERKEETELTMQEIADKFGISVNQLKIKK